MRLSVIIASPWVRYVSSKTEAAPMARRTTGIFRARFAVNPKKLSNHMAKNECQIASLILEILEAEHTYVYYK